MEYFRLGRSDLKVSAVGIGAWQWGTRTWGWGRSYGREDVISAFNRALDLGINLLDTAEIYGNGASERLAGEVLRARRSEVVVATKVSPLHLGYDGVLKAADRSLERLGIRTIDLYQIHWPNPLFPIETTMKAMKRLIQEGKIRYVGVSNFGVSRLGKAEEALAEYPLISNQVRYNLVQRGIEKELLPYCERKGISIIAYSPLAQGLLTGKYDPKNRPKDTVRSVNILFSGANLRRVRELLDALGEVARAHGRSMGQVALNWLIRDGHVVPIPGVKSAQQAEEIAQAVGWRLSEVELKRIDGASRGFKMEKVRSLADMALRLLFPWLR